MKLYKINKLKVEHVDVHGFEGALRGMRNPLDSWDRSDSAPNFYNNINSIEPNILIGEKDMILAKKLVKAGGEHRKFIRQIQVWCDITLPRYLWQELDTYMFGTKNSCSTMHTIMKKEITLDDFYIGEDPIIMTTEMLLNDIIPTLNYFRELYLESKDYRWVKEMKRVLPESFLQKRTWNTNYEELLNIYFQRKGHKLNEEWGVVLRMIEDLPYFQEMILDTLVDK